MTPPGGRHLDVADQVLADITARRHHHLVQDPEIDTGIGRAREAGSRLLQDAQQPAVGLVHVDQHASLVAQLNGEADG
jgi:hypothetical protein